MKTIQTTLARGDGGRILVHGSPEDKDLDCIVAHAIAPTYMKVRELAESDGALAAPGKTLAAIRDAFQNPELYDGGAQATPDEAPAPPPAPVSSPVGKTRPLAKIANPGLSEGFGRILSAQECADDYFPEYRAILDRVRVALEEDGRMRGESPLLDDIYALLEP